MYFGLRNILLLQEDLAHQWCGIRRDTCGRDLLSLGYYNLPSCLSSMRDIGNLMLKL